MAEYITRDMPNDYDLILTGDWHVGAKAFHEKAAREIVRELREEKRTFGVFMGDAGEGKKVDSPHFNPDALDRAKLTAGAQLDWWGALMGEAAKKWIVVIPGNHDLYLDRDAQLFERVCREHGLTMGGYQTWLSLKSKAGEVRGHLYHGRRNVPKGAKDRVQRRANRLAWLKRQFEDLAGSVNFHALGHTHWMGVLEPQVIYSLLDDKDGDNVKARHFIPPEMTVDGMPYIHPDARWYVNTGTLRRSGGFGYIDYAEIGGYSPEPIGYVRAEIRKGAIKTMYGVYL